MLFMSANSLLLDLSHPNPAPGHTTDEQVQVWTPTPFRLLWYSVITFLMRAEKQFIN